MISVMEAIQGLALIHYDSKKLAAHKQRMNVHEQHHTSSSWPFLHRKKRELWSTLWRHWKRYSSIPLKTFEYGLHSCTEFWAKWRTASGDWHPQGPQASRACYVVLCAHTSAKCIELFSVYLQSESGYPDSLGFKREEGEKESILANHLGSRFVHRLKQTVLLLWASFWCMARVSSSLSHGLSV